jgi:hypothetical protein
MGAMLGRHSSLAAIAIAVILIGCDYGASPESGTPAGGGVTFLPEPSAPHVGADATSFEDLAPGTELTPGTYVLNYASIGGPGRFPTLAITFTVPAGWSRVEIDGAIWHDADARLRIMVADNLYVDPCDPALGLRDPAIGPSVNDLSRALETVPGWIVERTSSGSFHGFPGIRAELRSPSDLSACGAGASRLLHTIGNPDFAAATGSDERHDLRIVDVEGTRLVIDAVNSGGASEAAKAELEALVDSIAIQP